jgi:predicted DNA-binding mobile mystery protein A
LKFKQFDEKLIPLKKVKVPVSGWICSIRKALKMTYSELAGSAKTKPQVIKIFENNETKGTITINTLHKVAETMECKLVYAIVPKKSFKSTVIERTEIITNKKKIKSTQQKSPKKQADNDKVRKKQAKELKNNIKNNFLKIFSDDKTK